jgi:hypothetical protein
VVPALAEIKPNHYAACIRISPEQPDIERVAPGDAPGLRNPAQVAPPEGPAGGTAPEEVVTMPPLYHDH